MENESIYGRWESMLPRVLKIMTDRITLLGETMRARRGDRPWEHLSGRVKTEKSMRDKLARMGLEATAENALTQVYDAVGIRVVCRFLNDIYQVADALKKMEGVRVVREKDYIVNAKENGYRSYHMILQVPGEGSGPLPDGSFYAEVQLRTIAMDTWAALEHEISYKQELKKREMIKKELKRCADELAACDVSMQAIRDVIDESSGEGRGA